MKRFNVETVATVVFYGFGLPVMLVAGIVITICGLGF